MSRFAAKQFASMAIHPAQLSSPVNCEDDWNRKASGSARRNICRDEKERQSAGAWSCSRTRTSGRHDDRDGLDDRLGYLHHFGRVVPAELFFGVAASTEIYTLSLHDALPTMHLVP